jgi:hypothetical protein
MGSPNLLRRNPQSSIISPCKKKFLRDRSLDGYRAFLKPRGRLTDIENFDVVIGATGHQKLPQRLWDCIAGSHRSMSGGSLSAQRRSRARCSCSHCPAGIPGRGSVGHEIPGLALRWVSRMPPPRGGLPLMLDRNSTHELAKALSGRRACDAHRQLLELLVRALQSI